MLNEDTEKYMNNLYSEIHAGRNALDCSQVHDLEMRIDFLECVGFVQGFIEGKGYTIIYNDIISDLNKMIQSRGFNTLNPPTCSGEAKKHQEVVKKMRKEYQMIDWLCVDYVKRWIMYHELFGGEDAEKLENQPLSCAG